jgi:short chain dehydrogenase
MLAQVGAGFVRQMVHGPRCYGSAGRVPACQAPDVKPSLSLEGKTASITGASRGIGLAMADGFLDAGANVMLSSRTAEDLAEAMAGPGVRSRNGCGRGRGTTVQPSGGLG